MKAEFLPVAEEDKTQLVQVPVKASIGTEGQGGGEPCFALRPQDGVPGRFEDNTSQVTGTDSG